MAKKLLLTLTALTALAFFLPAQTLQAQQQCDGPTYSCALHQTNAQLTIIPLPNPLQDMGGLVGANKMLDVEPYGTTDIRCTDVATDPTNTKRNSYEVTDTGGDWVYSWNSNQTLLRVVEQSAGKTIIVPFDSTQGKCLPMIPGSYAPAGAQWDISNPNVDYYENGMTTIMMRTFDYTKPTVPPTTTTLFDYAVVCKQLLSTLGQVSFNTQIVTNDGDLFSMAFGIKPQGQDTSQYVISYQVSADRCWLLNTLTGVVLRSRDLDPVANLGTVSTFFPFTIHSMVLTPANQLWIGVGSTCTNCPTPHGPFIWNPRTTTTSLLVTQPVGGHATYGNKTWVNLSAAPQANARLYSNLNSTWKVSSNYGVKYPTPLDSHMTWMNADPNDTYPICGTESSLNQPQPIHISTPLMQEMYCTDITNGTYIRLTPTFTTGLSNPDNFRTQQAIMAGGKKGFNAWSTDYNGQLGNTDGVHQNCTPGQKPPLQCRSDVFINIPWRMQTPAQAQTQAQTNPVNE